MQFNATIEIETSGRPEDVAEELVAQLVDFHPAAAPAAPGRLQVTVTVDSDNVKQAALVAYGLINQTGYEPVGLAVIATADYDARLGLAPDEAAKPLSVGEVAAELDMTRQAVLRRIDSGSLPASKTGGGWIISRAAVDEAKRHGRRRKSAAAAGR